MAGDWRHESVMLSEVLEFLKIKPGELYIDATVGTAGHSREIIRRGGRVIGFEVDPKTVAKLNEEEIAGLEIINENFTNIKKIWEQKGRPKISGILFDLGISLDQLFDPEKGLSFNLDVPLDMRLSPELGVRAADLVNALNERELYELFSKFGEERSARFLARALVDSRREKKFETTRELASLIEKKLGRRGKIHPATQAFMALRIAVNNEIENLEVGLGQASEIVESGGRIVVISFHSLEDRVTKEFFKNEKSLQVLTEKPLVPKEEELNRNPRSRSAKLRAAEKL